MEPKDSNPVTPISTTKPSLDPSPISHNAEQKPTTNPVATEQSVFQEIPPKPKSKILPLLIIISVLAVLGIFAYRYYQESQTSSSTEKTTASLSEVIVPSPVPTEDPTADWITLSNENGFSVKYPNTFKVLVEGMEVNEITANDIIIAEHPGDPNDTSPALRINTAQKSYTVYKDMTLEEISKINYEANQTNENTFKQIISPLAASTLDGKPAYTYTILANAYSGKWSGWPVNASLANAQNITVIESENNGIYFIIAFVSGDKTIESILSTFKFTGQ